MVDISVFCELLYSEMVKIGVPEDKAEKYIDNLRNNLTQSDITGVTEGDIPKYAQICADNIIKKNPESGDTTPVTNGQETAAATEINESAVTDTCEKSEDIPYETEELYEDSGNKITAKFFLVTIAASPLWLVAAAVFLAPFAVMFAAEIALIAALIALLAGCTALGTAASLTGIVYGVVKMFSVPAVGLYEIGFGVIIAGVAMICGILIYNGAVRFMPWVMKKSGKLFKFTFSKVKPLLAKYKRGLTK